MTERMKRIKELSEKYSYEELMQMLDNNLHDYAFYDRVFETLTAIQLERINKLNEAINNLTGLN